MSTTTTPTKPTPDYGEPWKIYPHSDVAEERDGSSACHSQWVDRLERIIACVNACAGMADPEKEIAAMRETHEHNRKAYAELEMCEKNALTELSISNDERDHYRRENAAMREAIKVALPLLENFEESARSVDKLPMCPECHRIAAWDEEHKEDCVVGKALDKLQPFVKP